MDGLRGNKRLQCKNKNKQKVDHMLLESEVQKQEQENFNI